jgi:phage baseplate assembly protein V
MVEAIVVDNVDPNKLGRVKVKFPTLPDQPESFWARLVMPMAGEKRGWMTIPEIDDEVLVAFMHGDFNHAIVLGSLYNGVDTPPYANEDGDNNLRVFQSRSGHRVTFDDTEGSERIEMITNNEEIQIIWDASGKTLSVYSGKDIILEAKDTFEIKCTDFIAKADTSVSIEAGSTLDFKAGSAGTIDGGGSLTLTASMTKING